MSGISQVLVLLGLLWVPFSTAHGEKANEKVPSIVAVVFEGELEDQDWSVVSRFSKQIQERLNLIKEAEGAEATIDFARLEPIMTALAGDDEKLSEIMKSFHRVHLDDELKREELFEEARRRLIPVEGKASYLDLLQNELEEARTETPALRQQLRVLRAIDSLREVPAYQRDHKEWQKQHAKVFEELRALLPDHGDHLLGELAELPKNGIGIIRASSSQAHEGQSEEPDLKIKIFSPAKKIPVAPEFVHHFQEKSPKSRAKPSIKPRWTLPNWVSRLFQYKIPVLDFY